MKLVDRTAIWHWVGLAASTLGLCLLLRPWIATASTLVAAMLVAMCLGIRGTQLTVPTRFVYHAQAIVGVAIASTLDVGGLAKTAADGWALIAVSLTVFSSMIVGWLVVRFASLPGTTGAWGSLPGAASVMGSLATENGGDGVLVSLMQYLRVVLVVATGPIIAHAVGDVRPIANASTLPTQGTDAFLGDAPNMIIALSISVLGCWVGTKLRILAGAFLVPLIVGASYKFFLPIGPHVPPVLLDACFVIIGWSIGLQFRRELATSMVRSLPGMLLAIVMMISMCAAWACLLAPLASTSFLTAYLATTPGGLDSVIAIAMGTNADMNFVVAVQTLRVFAVLIIGPRLARSIARTKKSAEM